jgi:GntR family transcriptional regulator
MTELSYAPRYREIEQALRARIASLRPGQRLPSDADLCAEFGVSRMTARHAMAQLADEGLVRRDPGRGTFVAEPPTHRRANFLMTFSHEMRRQGRRPSSRIVERRVRPPSESERRDLRIPADGEVIELRRVRLADGEPVALERAVLATRCIEPVLSADLESGSLHEVLIGQGMVPTRGKSSIRAEAASTEDAVLLGVAAGDPMLVERRLILDQRGRPIERTESRYAADRYGLNVGFSVEDGGALTIAPEASEVRSRRSAGPSNRATEPMTRTGGPRG